MKLSEILKKYGDCEVKDEVVDLIEKSLPKGKWKPQFNETYYFIGDTGLVRRSEWNDVGPAHKYRFDHMRIFKTEAEAKRYLEIMTAFQEASFEPDWRNTSQPKNYLAFDFIKNRLTPVIRYSVTDSNCNFYFESNNTLWALLKRFGAKDITKYVFGIELED